MAYTLQAIVGLAAEMASVERDDLITVSLSAEMALWPLDSAFQKQHGVPFLPLTDEGDSIVPTPILSVAGLLSRCAYVEAEIFGGEAAQASVVYENGAQIGEVVISDSAINVALQKLGIQSADGLDEFDIVGLGAERNTDAWRTHRAVQGGADQPAAAAK